MRGKGTREAATKLNVVNDGGRLSPRPRPELGPDFSQVLTFLVFQHLSFEMRSLVADYPEGYAQHMFSMIHLHISQLRKGRNGRFWSWFVSSERHGQLGKGLMAASSFREKPPPAPNQEEHPKALSSLDRRPVFGQSSHPQKPGCQHSTLSGITKVKYQKTRTVLSSFSFRGSQKRHDWKQDYSSWAKVQTFSLDGVTKVSLIPGHGYI